ncbi:hypothetical protein MVEG_08445 [Podila verticillata NRRL 6337]|nr:hypothetical protein MVEG_08445 [Podila verticillata NRRL 6337]
MRLPTLTAATVLAIATCIGIVHNAEGAENREVNQHPLEMLETSVDVDFVAENSDKFTSHK